MSQTDLSLVHLSEGGEADSYLQGSITVAVTLKVVLTYMALVFWSGHLYRDHTISPRARTGVI